MESKSFALWTGLFTLLAVLAIIVTGLWMGSRNAVGMVDYTLVSRQSVSGLSREAAVVYRGIPVGRVVSLKIDPSDNTRVLIRVKIDPAIKLSQATVAQLASQGITGLMYIELFDPGHVALLDPATQSIPLRPSMLQEVGNSIPETLYTVRMLSNRMNELLNDENRAQVSQILTQLAALSQQLPALGTQTQALLTQGTQLTQQLTKLSASTQHSLEQLTQHADATLQQVNVASQQLNQGAQQFNREIAPQLGQLLQQTRQTAYTMEQTMQLYQHAPSSVLFGAPKRAPGPGESGFSNTREHP